MSLVTSNDAAQQIRASDPLISAFVSANAGSGKTRTLVARVARLLLAGAEPQALLCVTFTKAAAAEMQRRLFDVLGEWSVLEDGRLRGKLADLEGSAPDAYDSIALSSARALFARALETPGGLKIQTIHAFCEKLLKRFPLEAGVSPGFEVADDAAAADLAAEARDAVATEAAFGDTPLAEAYERFSVALAFDAFQEMFRTFESKRGELGQWIDSLDGIALTDVISGLVGLEEWTEPAEAADVVVQSTPELIALWSQAAAVLAGASTKRDVALAATFQDLAERERRGDGVTLLELLRVFYISGGEGTPAAWTTGAAILRSHPGLSGALIAEQDRLGGERDRLRAARVARDTLDAMLLAAAYVEQYSAAKHRRRLLDFTDLVALTVDLLTHKADAAWVLYKLDGGIDHVLVDEAQDTAPEQWRVLRQLTEEFFAGAGAAGERRLERTVFVVGDEKQSIFSFQGAAPERLRAENTWYADRAVAAGRPWETVPLLESWRSTQAVLGFVDAAFDPPETREALLPGAAAIRHIALRLEQPGCVDLWPLEREHPVEERMAWDAPVDAQGPGAWRRLAERMASEIEALIARGEQVHDRETGQWRAATPGDVLILVRKRAALFEETIRALKRRGVPVAGADRLRLSEHPVFEDLLALIRFVQFPNDDLTLAGLLRSPFCDVDETSLYHLAYERPGSLWTALQTRAAERPEWASARALLEQVRAEAATRTPFDLLTRLFASLDAEGRSLRSRFLTRLGPEAADVLDETLAQVLAAEGRGARDLESLCHALARLDVEVKREMDQPRLEVRVMTAHGAKGLEAPIVFLPETVTAGEPHGSPLLQTEDGGFLWCSSGKNDCDASAAARELRKRKGEAESLRLLYVALTRARDRVVLAGRVNATAKLESLKGWRPVVEAAFNHAAIAGEARRLVSGDMEFLRFGQDPRLGPAGAGATPVPAALPPWARTPAAPEPRALRWASPSEMADQARAPAQSPLAATGGMGRFRRGELIHKLFEILPEVAAAEQAAVAGTYLAGQPDLTDAQREEISAAVFAVLGDDRFAEVFGPGSRAEVALAGSAPGLPKGLAISGRLDRLVVTPTRVLVVDYKTNRPAPTEVADADPAYLAQMAAYAAVLRALYPGRTVEAALLWTDGPKLTPISDALIASALQRLSAS